MKQSLTRCCAVSGSMNKARRHELKMLKYRRRLKKYGIKEGPGKNLFAFRSHGAPCSCAMCSGDKYDRAKERNYEFTILTKEEVMAKRCNAYAFEV